MSSGTNGSHANGIHRSSRIPTVDEAIAFTPFTSIVPFDTAVVPLPTSLNSAVALKLFTASQATEANEALKNAERANDRLHRTLSDLRALLTSGERPKFNLKTPQVFREQSGAGANGHHRSAQRDPVAQLAPFARRVYEQIPLRGGRPTAPTVNGSSAEGHAVSGAQSAHQASARSIQAPQHTAVSNLVQSSPLEKRQQASQTTQNGHMSIANPVLSQEELAQFTAAPGSDSQPAPETQQPRYHPTLPTSGETGAAAHLRDKATSALQNFEALVTALSEAEIDFESNPDSRNESFTGVESSEGGTIAVLQPEAQFRLDKVTTSVLRFKVINSVPIDDLAHMQKLCCATIRAVGDRYLGIGASWDEQDYHEWMTRLALVDQAFVAARTVMKIMSSGIEDKQLFSEDILGAMLDFFKNTVETCVKPIVEMRPTDDNADAWKFVHRNRDKITRVFGSLTKAVSLLGDVIRIVDLDDTALTTIESMCIDLIFVENSPSETASSLGIQVFERVRRAAMDALAKLFDRNMSHRQSIFDDVLTSLEKLPVGRQSARQYTLPDAKAIQLVSALLLRLIQTSALVTDAQVATKKKAADPEDSDEDADGEDDDDYQSHDNAQKQKAHLNEDLESAVIPAYEKATGHARYIANFLVSRAINSTKSSGEPYRVLLDIFVDDFMNVLGNTDWPAAELILRQLVTRLWDITESSSKASVPSKAMALEFMGSMLTGITDMRLKAADMVEKAQEESPLTERLKECYTLGDADEATDAISLSVLGPYRAVLEFLRLRPDSDSNASTAMGYHITQWAQQVLRPAGRESSESLDAALPALTQTLEHLIRDPEFHDIGGESVIASTAEGRLGALLVTMRLPFCRLFNQMFNKLLTSMSSDQASLRSKSLRSVEDVLTKDPSILDRGTFVLNNIARCMTDSSPQVRDAALGLLATCLNMRQELDGNVYEHILKRTSDNAVNVRKRAIKMAKDLYLRNESTAMRAKIADALIHCVSDPEPTVIELGRQTLEEIWIAPFYETSKGSSGDAQSKTKLALQVLLMIETVRRNPNVSLVLQDILEDMMSPKSKSASSNIPVCKSFVLLMVDAIVDPTSLPGQPPRSATMQTLSILAQARPKLFSAAQVQPLLPYLKNLQTGEDLTVYRYAIIILRSTLPQISNLPQNVLLDSQSSLLANVSKLPASELKEVASCLWALSKMSNSTDKLVAITRSAMENLKNKSGQLGDEKAAKQVTRLLSLVGHLVAAFDLDSNIQAFKDKFPKSKATQVVAIATEIVCPLTSPKSPSAIRATALEAMLCLCHSWPSQYLRPDVGNAIEVVLGTRDSALEMVLMTAWKNFFVPGSDRRPVDDKQANASAPGVGAERIEKTYVATDRDGASTSLAQRFMSQIIHISLNSIGELSVVAAHVVTSINKLGLVHPKESASALVALETCPDANIAKLAFEEHNALFSKHESIFEKETIRAVQQAFEYQRNTIKDIQGCTGSPPAPKLQLFWDVLKNASAKVRKRFLSNICGLLDFQHGKLNMSGSVPIHVQMTVFCVQNLALFDYTKAEDLQTLVDGLEKVFASTGTAVAHGIEATLMHKDIILEAAPAPAPIQSSAYSFDFGTPTNDDSQEFFSLAPQPEAKPSKPTPSTSLRELTAGAQILTLIWDLRTYLRRVYSLTKNHPPAARGRPAKDQTKPREAARAPQRVPNAIAMTDKFLKRTHEILAAIDDPSTQRELCLSFQTLMAIDDEVKVKPEDEEPAMASLQEEDAAGWTSEAESLRSGGGTPGRKRKGSTPAGTPRKKRPRSGSRGRKSEEEWF